MDEHVITKLAEYKMSNSNVMSEVIGVQSWSLIHAFFCSVSFEDHHYSEFVQNGSIPSSFTVWPDTVSTASLLPVFYSVEVWRC